MGGYVGKDFACFLDENVEQFRVNLFLAGGQQLGRFLGRGRHRQRCVGDVFLVFDDGVLGGRGGVDFGRSGRRLGRGLGDRGCLGGGRRAGRGRQCVGVGLAGKVVALGAPAGEAVDVEAERREQVGERFEQCGVRRLSGVGELRDHGVAVRQRVVRVALAEQREDAFDLLHRLAHGVETVALFGGAEEGVEGLFDLREAGLHLLAQLHRGAALLCLARRGAGFVRGDGFAARACFDARDGVFDLGREGGVGHAPRVERVIGQQQRRGDLHRDRVGEAQRVFAQPLGEGRQGGHQAHEGGAAELAAGVGQRRHASFEGGQRGGGAFGKLVPRLLGLIELVAQLGEQRCQRQLADGGVGRRQQRAQLVQAVQCLDQRRGGGGAGDDVHGVAVEALGKLVVAGEQAPDLGVQAAAQATDVRRHRHVAFGQHFAERGGAEPEGPGLLLVLARLDAGDGFAHHARAGRVVGLAHPGQQTLLEADAHGAQEAHFLGRVEDVGRGAARDAGAQVGEKQVALGGRLGAARHGDAGVQLGQPQWLVGGAVGQLVEVVAGGGNAAPADVGDRFAQRDLLARQLAQQLVEAVGELGQSVEADDRQRAACLVEVRLRKLQARAAFVLAARGLFDGLQRAAQGLIDFALDPGEGAEIVFGGVGH